jgi:predicted dehydrogenase
MDEREQRLGVAIIGCGDISEAYADGIAAINGVTLRGAWDRHPERVARFASQHGGHAFSTLEELLADDHVDVVVNLTRQASHAELTARCLTAGKHVYSEKPLALSYREAAELAALAERTGRRLACAPIGYLGEAQRTAWQVLRDGTIGEVRVAYAEVNWGRIERWHPRPAPFYEVGVAFDVGVYPLTLLTAMLGPARGVSAYGRVLLADRTSRDGEPFTVDAPDFIVAIVELQSGAIVRLTTSFYVEHGTKQQGMEIHGDRGSIALDSWFRFNAGVELALDADAYEVVDVPGDPPAGVDYARGLAELVDAIAEGRPHRASADHAAHVVEILEAIHTSAATAGRVPVHSTFASPW